jgi:dipeptidyl aminopeptidase/acylaminoacyl peptidase
MRLISALALAIVTVSSSPAHADTPVLAQQPALSSTQVVFVFAGDLWTVLKSGGEARRLTTASGVESNPSFSPDGRWIAFTGQAVQSAGMDFKSASAGPGAIELDQFGQVQLYDVASGRAIPTGLLRPLTRNFSCASAAALR